MAAEVSLRRFADYLRRLQFNVIDNPQFKCAVDILPEISLRDRHAFVQMCIHNRELKFKCSEILKVECYNNCKLSVEERQRIMLLKCNTAVILVEPSYFKVVVLDWTDESRPVYDKICYER